MANHLVAVPNNMICEAVKFLILSAQQPDGMFREVGSISHGEMIVCELVSLNMFKLRSGLLFVQLCIVNNTFLLM